MHMFFQFYREFTPELLNEFYSNERIFPIIVPKPNNKIKVEEGDSRLNCEPDANSEIDEKSECEHLTEFDKKKDLITRLFRKYSKIPIETIVQNYFRTYKSVFVNEKPALSGKYFLSEISLIQKINKSCNYKNLFYYCFTTETTRDADFGSFKLSKEFTKKVIKHIDKGENFHSEGNQNANLRIQMYEFFFSNSLMKSMKVPFMEDTYMISYFERVVRK